MIYRRYFSAISQHGTKGQLLHSDADRFHRYHSGTKFGFRCSNHYLFPSPVSIYLDVIFTSSPPAEKKKENCSTEVSGRTIKKVNFVLFTSIACTPKNGCALRKDYIDNVALTLSWCGTCRCIVGFGNHRSFFLANFAYYVHRNSLFLICRDRRGVYYILPPSHPP